MLERLELMIGKEGVTKISKIKVLVIGIGGVGGSCVKSLVRSGISNVVLIDYDIVESSNLNRQEVAFISTIGQKKIDVMENIIHDINPNCKVIKYDIFLDPNKVEELLSFEKPDYILDMCDFVKTKVAICEYAFKNNIKIISSMGVGNRLDPTKLLITTLNKTTSDPLAKKVRNALNNEDIAKKTIVLASTEIPKIKGKVVSSNSFVPNTAGMIIASYVINDIISESNV